MAVAASRRNVWSYNVKRRSYLTWNVPEFWIFQDPVAYHSNWGTPGFLDAACNVGMVGLIVGIGPKLNTRLNNLE